MNHDSHSGSDELFQLIDSMIEDRLAPDQVQRLEHLVLNDDHCMRQYVNYMNLHGNLFWDAAYGVHDTSIVTPAIPTKVINQRSPWIAPLVTIACLLIIAVSWWAIQNQGGQNPVIVDENNNQPVEIVEKNQTASEESVTPVRLPRQGVEKQDGNSTLANESGETHFASSENSEATVVKLDSDEIVARIDNFLQEKWDEQNVRPTEIANDSEWIRRAFLDLAGRIPTVEETETFLADKSRTKRPKLVEDLIHNGDFARHWTTVWSNLLVGRLPRNSEVNLIALREFLHEDFSTNRGWNETVADMIAAEGDPNKNGEANFLVAHLNNQAVPATAVTCRLFLGMQIQCTQCHNHPSNDWTQQDFWELNSFFKQAKVEKDASGVQLVSQKIGGPTFFQSRRGIMKVAYPKIGKQAIGEDAGIDRRSELAKILAEGGQPQLASSMVNRVWAHFFGFGFVNPIDDMGPHNAASHPELLELLSEQFVLSGYDTQALVRWITASRGYQLSSRFNSNNAQDNPQIGEPPLFSRMYVKPMSAEQIYDSLLVASQKRHGNEKAWFQHVAQRDQWVRQFFRIYQTEENDEDSQMNGTIPQALEFMNGALVSSAIESKTSKKRAKNLITSLTEEKTSEAAKIRKLCLAALSREPTNRELTLFKKYVEERIRKRSSDVPRSVALGEGLQDVYWAYLNSCEFVLVP